MDKDVPFKIASVVIPPLAAICAWALMVQYSPPKNAADIIRRLMASFASSMVLGTALLIYLHHSEYEIFTIASEATLELWGYADIGNLAISGIVFFICGVPGWWLVAGVAGWLDKNSEKLIKKALDKALDE